MVEVAAFKHVRSQKYYPPRVTSRNEDYHKLYRFNEENVGTMVRGTLSGTSRREERRFIKLKDADANIFKIFQ
jgi:hypothetical protein